MNRHYDSAQYLELVHYGRALMPDLVLTSDVIVGFPGETEEEFEDTIELIEHVRYDALFTFIFSPRGGHAGRKDARPDAKGGEEPRALTGSARCRTAFPLEIHQSLHRQNDARPRGREGRRPADRPGQRAAASCACTATTR